MKIYTKTGDGGTTALFGGGRVPKHHIRIEAYGTVDELNSYIGLVRDQDIKPGHKKTLKSIQDKLFSLGATLATNPEKANVKAPSVKESDILFLESEIDAMEATLEPLKNFILPGGHPVVSHCHVARCICRRAERNVSYLAENEPVPEIVVKYLNRLSDFLFVKARKLAQDLDCQEIVWQAPVE